MHDTTDALIADLTRQMFKEHCLKLPLHVAAAHGELDAELWSLLVDGGFEQTIVTGADTTLRDAIGILHSAGYYAARVPLAESMLAHWLAGMVGSGESSSLPVVALRSDEPPRDPARGLRGVPWARYATALYVVDAAQLLRFDAPAIRVEPAENLAGEPRDTVWLDEDSAKRWNLSVGPDRVLATAALLRAGLMVGAMERALDLALDHASTRVQFGKPIGRFQAVQQLLAQLAGHVAAAAAALDLGASNDSVFAAAVAKARAGEAAGVACDIAHQVIAAMGYTAEHPLQLVSRRLWAWRDECGSETYWHRRIGAAALATGGAGLWQAITSQEGLHLAAKNAVDDVAYADGAPER